MFPYAHPDLSAKIGSFLRKYKLHSTNKRIVKKKFPRRRVICTHINQLMMGDLIVWPEKYRYQNNNYRYILVVIDCFSKKMYSSPIKQKLKESVADALDMIFSSLSSYPTMFVTDAGTGSFQILFR